MSRRQRRTLTSRLRVLVLHLLKGTISQNGVALAGSRPLSSSVSIVGVILGLGIGIPGFLYLRSPAWLLLWGVLFVALWRIAGYAEPVFEASEPGAVEAKSKMAAFSPKLPFPVLLSGASLLCSALPQAAWPLLNSLCQTPR